MYTFLRCLCAFRCTPDAYRQSADRAGVLAIARDRKEQTLGYHAGDDGSSMRRHQTGRKAGIPKPFPPTAVARWHRRPRRTAVGRSDRRSSRRPAPSCRARRTSSTSPMSGRRTTFGSARPAGRAGDAARPVRCAEVCRPQQPAVQVGDGAALPRRLDVTLQRHLFAPRPSRERAFTTPAGRRTSATPPHSRSPNASACASSFPYGGEVVAQPPLTSSRDQRQRDQRRARLGRPHRLHPAPPRRGDGQPRAADQLRAADGLHDPRFRRLPPRLRRQRRQPNTSDSSRPSRRSSTVAATRQPRQPDRAHRRAVRRPASQLHRRPACASAAVAGGERSDRCAGGIPELARQLQTADRDVGGRAAARSSRRSCR